MSYFTVQTDAVTGAQTIIPFSAEEIATVEANAIADAWVSLRSERDRLLSASDWTQVADAPVDQVAWANYRQALRDLPENTTDPFNPVWPEKPV
jgi:hypothetical protein